MIRKSILRLSTVAAAIALSGSVLSGSVLAMEATYATEPESADEMTCDRTVPQEALAAPLATGSVVAVDRAAGRITLEYRPIPELFLEGGTKIFQVETPTSLTGLTPGDKVRFGVEREEDRSYVITRIEHSN